MAKNEGKKFEDCLINSIDKSHVLVKRLNDNAASFGNSMKTRFSSSNECDFIMVEQDTNTFYGLELKSTKGNSLTFWREDFEDKNSKTKKHFAIRKCQIEGLKKWSDNYKGVYGLIINFREKNNRTFFITIKDFIDYTSTSTFKKKSISYDDILNMNYVEIENELLRTNYKYNMDKFFKETSMNKNVTR